MNDVFPKKQVKALRCFSKVCESGRTKWELIELFIIKIWRRCMYILTQESKLNYLKTTAFHNFTTVEKVQLDA